MNQFIQNPSSTLETSSLFEMAKSFDIFSSEKAYTPQVVSSAWYTFSKYMPTFLLEMAGSLSTNELKVNMAGIAYEELGFGNTKKIHERLFFNACKEIDLNPEDMFLKSLEWLKLTKSTLSSDQEVLGLSLGMEIIANENIAFLVQGLSPSDSSRKKLSKTEFFVIHFENEQEHIDKNIQSFKDFISTNAEEEKFLYGLSVGLNFWKNFWEEISDDNE